MAARIRRSRLRHAGIGDSPRRAAARTRPLRFEPLEDRHLLSAVRLDAPRPLGDVTEEYEVSSDGRFGVYVADAETDSRYELYSVEFSTGEVRKLSHTSLQRRVKNIQISPDSSRVVYRTWERTESRHVLNELFSVPINGGDAIKLSGPMVSGGGAFEYFISPDSGRVVYRADQDTNGVHELFSVPLEGGTVTKLNRPLSGADDVQPDFELSADSSRVVFRAGRDDAMSLFNASVAGGDLIEVDDLLPNSFPAGDGELAEISPDGSHLVYLSGSELFTVELATGSVTTLGTDVKPGFQISADSAHVIFVSGSDLFRTPLGGGAAIRLNDPLVQSGEVLPDPQITPDSSRVVYRADQDTDDVIELYTVPITGGPSTKLNNTLVLGGDVAPDRDGLPQPDFQITPDSQRVMYLADARTDGVLELHSASLDGSGSTVLSHVPLSLSGYLEHYLPSDDRFPRISPDSNHAVYWVDGEVYRVPITGGESIKLNGELVVGGRVSGYRFTPDGGRLVYRAMQDSYGIWELFSAPVMGGNPVKHSGPMLALGHAFYSDHHSETARLTPDGKFALYRSSNSTESEERIELYSVEIATGAVARLSNGLVDGGVLNYEISPDSSHVVYGVAGLFSVPITGGRSVKLADALPGAWTSQLRFTSDSSRVLYSYPFQGLYSAPLVGGSSTRLDDLGDDSDVSTWWTSPDNRWVLYSANGEPDVYSVPIGGGQNSKLIGKSVGDASLRRIEIAPDGSRVVYWGDEETAGKFELFSVPIAGGAAVKLNGPLVDDGNVDREFTISPDSRRVIYQADQDTDEVSELYSVPISGGEATKLNGPLIEGGVVPYTLRNTNGGLFPNWGAPQPTDGGDVFDFQVSADSRLVVYRADQETDEQAELFSVPVGGGEPMKLNSPLEVGQGVLAEYAVTPDGSSVVFASGERTSYPADLFGVPIDGGSPVRLGESVILQDHLLQPDLGFSSDSSRLVYRSRSSDGKTELYSAAIATADTVKLNSTLVAGGNVTEYTISDDGRKVVYRADQDQDNVFELYAVPATGGRPEKLNGPLVPGGSVSANEEPDYEPYAPSFGFAITADNTHVVYLADEGVRQLGLYGRTLPEQPDLLVSSFVPDSSGFTLQFNSELDASRVNLYDAESVQLGAEDVTLNGAVTGLVPGSLVVDDSSRGARFIVSGGVLAPDTYTVYLRSGSESFKSADQTLLDGDGEGLAGDDYFASFTISDNRRVVGIPDFVRGPGQAIDNLSGNDIEGIPLTISDAAGLRSISLQIEYDPALLMISAAQVGPDMPAGAGVTIDTPTPGVAVLAFTSDTDLPSGAQTLAYLQAIIPEADAGSSNYGLHQIVQLESLVLEDADGNQLPAVADHALQVVAIFGDVTLNGRLNSADASRVTRVAAELDSGFAANTLIDPRVLADVTGNGTINASDALWLTLISIGRDPTVVPPSDPRDDTPTPPPPDPPDIPPVTSTMRLDNPQAIVGDVTEFVFTSDGQFAVYLADSTTEHQFELYSVELASGEVQKLSGIAEGGNVVEFQVSRDDRRVVYRTAKTNGSVELFSVSVEGGESTRLNGPSADVGSIYTDRTSFLISPDSSQVVYLADRGADDVVELFSVPIEGGVATRLNRDLVSGGDVFDFKISSDSRHVVYRGDQDRDVVLELYRVPLTGGTITRLNEEFTGPGGIAVGDYEISPDNNYVIYNSNHLDRRTYRLYGVPMTGGAVTPLSSQRVSLEDAQFSPDSSHVVYQQGQDLYSFPVSGGEPLQLDTLGALRSFQVSPDSRHVVFVEDRGGVPTLLSTPLGRRELTNLSGESPAAGFRISPDGLHVLYVGYQVSGRRNQLYRVPIGGGDLTRLSDSEHDVEPEIQLTPDGGHVVYLADHVSLYSVPVAGGSPTELSDPVPDGRLRVDRAYPVSETFQISADSQWVAFDGEFLAEGAASWVYGVFSVPLSGGSASPRSELLSTAAQLGDFSISPSSDRLVYIAEQDLDGVSELFSSPVTGGGSTKLSAPQMSLGGNVTDIQLSPDGQFAVYRADHDVEGIFELYTVSNASGGMIKLNGTLLAGNVEPDFQISADGSRVVYRAKQDDRHQTDLYSVWLTGGGRVTLNRPLAEGEVHDFEISADGRRVVYRAAQTHSSSPRLYSVPSTGGQVTKIDGLSTRYGSVRSFQVAPEGSSVVYFADQETRGLAELFRVPITGGEFNKVSGPLGTTGRIYEYQVSPDGRRVVYRASQERRSHVDLYSVPITGGEAVNLSGPLDTYDGFHIASNGNWVVFPDGGQLYRVSMMGGPAIQLNDPNEGYVQAGPVISPDGARVVYLTAEHPQRYFGENLYSVSITGGSTTKLTNGRTWFGYQITPDGNTVVFRADHDAAGVIEIYAVPISGGDFQKLNGPLVAHGDVSERFTISPDGKRLIYTADQDFDRQVGIYRASLPQNVF